MNKTSSQYIKIFWCSLLLLFFIASVFMIKRVISPHNRMVHIIIKPSSANDNKEIAESLKKILFPIFIEKKGIEIVANGNLDLENEISHIFSTTKPYAFKINIVKINLNQNLQAPCLMEIQKRMVKKKDQWNNEFFFAACTTDPKELFLAIAKSSK